MKTKNKSKHFETVKLAMSFSIWEIPTFKVFRVMLEPRKPEQSPIF